MEIIRDFTSYAGKISNCGHDERGKYSGGVAGDQSGTEWYIRKWWNDRWDTVIRFEDPDIADTIATLAIRAAQNNAIGYDQSQRTSFWTALKAAGYDPAKIKTPCEADCSSGVLTIVKAALILTGHPEQAEPVSVWGYTGNEAQILKGTGAKVSFLQGKEYTGSTKRLLHGDILLNSTTHTAINLGDGPDAPKREPVKVYHAGKNPVLALQTALNAAYDDCEIAVTGKYDASTKAAVKAHTLKRGMTGPHVEWLQEALNAVGYTLEVDGSFGPLTFAAVCDLHSKQLTWKVTGKVGKKTTKKLITKIKALKKAVKET